MFLPAELLLCFQGEYSLCSQLNKFKTNTNNSRINFLAKVSEVI